MRVVVLLVALGIVPAMMEAQQATTEPAPGWAHVTYISGGTIYVDAGSRAGLREGSRLEVVRGSQTIAQLAVAFISSTRAACTVISSTADPVVGDSARFVPVLPPVAEQVAARTDSLRPKARRNTVHGRLGLRYLMAQPGNGAPTWRQPAADLRLEGHQVGGSPMGILVDVRAYRQRTGATGRTAAGSTRVYQGHLEWNPATSPLRVSVGRQLAPALSTLGIFDGMSMELSGRHLNVGAVGATQPDPVTFGLSGITREYGAYVQAHSAPSIPANWSLTFGGIGSYNRGEIDREFGYLQALLTTRRVSLFATQELDVNRGWKADVEGRSTVPTSTFAMLRLSPTDVISFNVGFDNRRNVRLYRDFVDPVTEFDDTFRQGEWAGVTINAGSHVRLSSDARQSHGGVGAGSRSYTGSLGVYRLTPLGLGANVRASSFSGAVAEGRLVSASLQVNPWNRLHLEASGGTRSDLRPVAGTAPRDLRWQGVDADIVLGRSLYFMVSTYREYGDVGRSTQGYAALSWRF